MSHKLKPCPRCGANMPVVGGGGGGGGKSFIVSRCSNEACRHELTEEEYYRPCPPSQASEIVEAVELAIAEAEGWQRHKLYPDERKRLTDAAKAAVDLCAAQQAREIQRLKEALVVEQALKRLAVQDANEYQTRAEQAERERDEAYAQADAHEQKWRSICQRETCACSYDRPEDVCAYHSPKLAVAEARVKELEDRLCCGEGSDRELELLRKIEKLIFCVKELETALKPFEHIAEDMGHLPDYTPVTINIGASADYTLTLSHFRYARAVLRKEG